MTSPRLALISFLSIVPCCLYGNGFRLVSQDAFAAARAEAFAATADNPSAIHYNPAGISQLDGQQVRMGIYALHFEPTFTPPEGRANEGETYGIEKNNAFAPQLYYTYEIPKSLFTLGLGVYAPHGASVTWPQDTGFRTVATEGALTYLRVNPVISMDLAPGLSIAGGVMVDSAEIALEQGLRRSTVLTNSFRFEGDDLAVGYNLGLLWKINEKFTFGATYRSRMLMNFEGESQIEFQPTIQPTDVPATTALEFPYTAVLGLSYRPTERWNIEVNADYSNWSTISETEIKHQEKPPFPVKTDVPVRLGWKDSWIFKLGATHYFDEGWYASSGYLFNENSVPSEFYSPTAADLDRHFLTLGVGRKWSRYTVDVAYQFGYGFDREVKGSTPSSSPGQFAGQNADGTYGFESHGVLLSFGVKF